MSSEAVVVQAEPESIRVEKLQISGIGPDYEILDENGQPIKAASMVVVYFNRASKLVVGDLYVGGEAKPRFTNLPIIKIGYEAAQTLSATAKAAAKAKR